MRLALAVVIAMASPASADPLPSGSIAGVAAATSGTGADASRLGFGYEYGWRAAWEPMTTERRLGYTLRWSTMFGGTYDATAARLDDLRVVLMDFTAGLRFRPWTTPTRYLNASAGVEMLRSNQELPPAMERTYIGPVASFGIDQYKWILVFSVDVKYGLIANGPSQIALVFGVGTGL
ncbi:MAG TPA: hypothetical protein VGO00_08020 [Kofleriaceae bacterium]|jgi:hypothetical protein|nr:hypothetical protein [Kofleriaceae bacterium]